VTDDGLRDSAQIGVAASLEANGKTDESINAFLVVANRGEKSPYAPFAYFSAARLYEEKGDKENERQILSQAASLDPDSPFVKQAQAKLNQLNAANKPTGPASVPTSISTTPAAATAPTSTPVPVTPASATTPTPVPPTGPSPAGGSK
jgi:tetratricopeptide (TPR) repeat protein